MQVSKFKDFSKEKICKEFIKAWKPLFDAYPELNAVPVYAWGRYYKYELAGSPFEIYLDDRGLSRFRNLISYPQYDLETREYLVDGADIQWDLIKRIDDEHNNPGGKLWTGVWGDYSPYREDVVKAFRFDDRGGRCLVIMRKGHDFVVKEFKSDSPE